MLGCRCWANKETMPVHYSTTKKPWRHARKQWATNTRMWRCCSTILAWLVPMIRVCGELVCLRFSSAPFPHPRSLSLARVRCGLVVYTGAGWPRRLRWCPAALQRSAADPYESSWQGPPGHGNVIEHHWRGTCMLLVSVPFLDFPIFLPLVPLGLMHAVPVGVAQAR